MSSHPRFSDSRIAASASESHTLNEIEALLGRMLVPVLSARRTARPLAEGIASLARGDQNFVMHWITVIARTNIELAFQFAAIAPDALGVFDAHTAERWVIHAMDTYDREGLHRGSEMLRQPGRFVAEDLPSSATRFEEVARILQFFVQGLAGRPLRLEAGSRCYTDTAALYLPARIARGASADENFFLYKATAALLWAQTRYGTFSADLHEISSHFPDRERALSLLNALETIRLESRIALTLPALARDMADLPRHRPLDPRCARLLAPCASVEDSIVLLHALYENPPAFDQPYETTLEPDLVSPARNARLAREKRELQAALRRLLEAEGSARASRNAASFSLELGEAPEHSAPAHYILAVDGEPFAPSAEVDRLVDSILQDLGRVPDEYLTVNCASIEGDDEQEVEDSARPAPVELRTFFYDEWDCRRRHYRKNWCVVRELDVASGDARFVESTLVKYAARIVELKRAFELMRGEERLLKRQADGDGVDFDALVEAYADMRAGTELAPLLFTKRRRHERDLAVMFMVDMSGSTKGWINDAEREALVMLCEALEVLGDRYAICGFSGITRKRCEIFRVKRFDERYGPEVRSRIAGIVPQDYTRMGAAIRHVTMLLNDVQARTKLLVTLSDGKPDDYSDDYRGEYGIEDTRQALIEAHRVGVKPFCITIDREARDYLPHMYGAANWTLIDDVARLPVKVAEIYRRLTT